MCDRNIIINDEPSMIGNDVYPLPSLVVVKKERGPIYEYKSPAGFTVVTEYMTLIYSNGTSAIKLINKYIKKEKNIEHFIGFPTYDTRTWIIIAIILVVLYYLYTKKYKM